MWVVRLTRTTDSLAEKPLEGAARLHRLAGGVGLVRSREQPVAVSRGVAGLSGSPGGHHPSSRGWVLGLVSRFAVLTPRRFWKPVAQCSEFGKPSSGLGGAWAVLERKCFSGGQVFRPAAVVFGPRAWLHQSLGAVWMRETPRRERPRGDAGYLLTRGSL